MKKLFILLCLALLIFPVMVSAKDKKKINVYIFHGDGCPHCANALKFFDSIKDEYGKYYKLVKYETWTSMNAQYNSKVMKKVAEEYKEDPKQLGVPFIIIGDKVFKGYSKAYDEDIKKAIVDAYNDEDYVDRVKPIVTKMRNGIITNVAVAGSCSVALIGLIVLNLYLRRTKKES